jgi:hypothetical protein
VAPSAPSNVSGRTEKLAHADRGDNRLNAARNARSARVSRGRADWRRRTANTCRNTKISRSFDRPGRTANTISPSTPRTARYTNDQSKRPSPDRLQEGTEPTGAAASDRPARVSEPYASSRGGSARARWRGEPLHVEFIIAHKSATTMKDGCRVLDAPRLPGSAGVRVLPALDVMSIRVPSPASHSKVMSNEPRTMSRIASARTKRSSKMSRRGARP